MATKIRLMRIGRKKRPFYRIVAVDSRARRDGKYIEKIGHYDPMNTSGEDAVSINEELAMKWLKVGAIPTDTTRNLFSKAGIMKKFADEKIAAKK